MKILIAAIEMILIAFGVSLGFVVWDMSVSHLELKKIKKRMKAEDIAKIFIIFIFFMAPAYAADYVLTEGSFGTSFYSGPHGESGSITQMGTTTIIDNGHGHQDSITNLTPAPSYTETITAPDFQIKNNNDLTDRGNDQ